MPTPLSQTLPEEANGECADGVCSARVEDVPTSIWLVLTSSRHRPVVWKGVSNGRPTTVHAAFESTTRSARRTPKSGIQSKVAFDSCLKGSMTTMEKEAETVALSPTFAGTEWSIFARDIVGIGPALE